MPVESPGILTRGIVIIMSSSKDIILLTSVDYSIQSKLYYCCSKGLSMIALQNLCRC